MIMKLVVKAVVVIFVVVVAAVVLCPWGDTSCEFKRSFHLITRVYIFSNKVPVSQLIACHRYFISSVSLSAGQQRVRVPGTKLAWNSIIVIVDKF